MKMHKLTEIIYKIKLNNVRDALKNNARKIELAVTDNYHDYNSYRLEQLRLMSNKSYSENKLSKLSYSGNQNAN
jgi:hypothetical protein